MDEKEKERKFEEIIQQYSTVLHATARRELYVNGATYD